MAGSCPYGGTFLVFADYARGAMRLSSLMGLRVVYVLTHDSIGLGEDGPTHQPIEHLAMLRATPNLNVYRPCDVVETAEAWEMALSTPTTPSVLALTRQNLPTLRTTHSRRNLVARGAYVLEEADGKRQAVLLATGSEVEVAMKARDLLQGERDRHACRLDAVLGALRGAGRRATASKRATQGAGAGRGRGGDPLRLGPVALRRARRAAASPGSSACTASAPRVRSRRSIRISASRPRRLPRRPRASCEPCCRLNRQGDTRHGLEDARRHRSRRARSC
jgi:hypothetical protein